MKRIVRTEPDFYKKFREKNKPRPWEDLSKEIGYEVREYMLSEEQNSQCAYTETALGPDPGNSHVDHFRKQSLFADLIFDWNNLLTSCNGKDYGAGHKDRKIREKKDYECLINPVAEDPHEYFYYALTGEILAAENNKKGQFTIDAFKLNHRSLVNQRADVVRDVQSITRPQ